MAAGENQIDHQAHEGKGFYRLCTRENILECELIGIPIDEFAKLALIAMQEISDELGFWQISYV